MKVDDHFYIQKEHTYCMQPCCVGERMVKFDVIFFWLGELCQKMRMTILNVVFPRSILSKLCRRPLPLSLVLNQSAGLLPCCYFHSTHITFASPSSSYLKGMCHSFRIGIKWYQWIGLGLRILLYKLFLYVATGFDSCQALNTGSI